MSEDQGEGREHPVGPGHPPKEHRWKPGQSGNPGGRKPGLSITAVLRKMLDEAVEDTQGNKVKMKRAVARALLVRALGGDVRAIRELLDRTEGKVAEKHEVWGSLHMSTTDLINKAMNGGFQDDGVEEDGESE